MIGITLRRVAQLENAGYRVGPGVCSETGPYWYSHTRLDWSDRTHYPTQESAWAAANRKHREARLSFALGYVAGLLDNRIPGPWHIRRRMRDAVLRLAGDRAAAWDGFDAGVGDRG